MNIYYLAHPYTGAPEDNTRLSAQRAARLMELGYWVFNPLTHSHPIEQELDEPIGYDWLNLDCMLIQSGVFDGLILCPGWEDSEGCRTEKALAEAIGLPVLHYSDIRREHLGT